MHTCLEDNIGTLDTFGINLSNTIFSLGVSQHMHKITNLCKFWLNLSPKLQENSETLVE